VSAELGITPGQAKHLISVYEFMIEHNETATDRWSYYNEYLKSSKIKKARDTFPTFDKLIVSKIKSGEIKRAVDVRDDLPTICVGPIKNLKRFAENKTVFSGALEIAVESGGDNPDYKKINKFRQWLATTEAENDLLDTPKNIRDKLIFELKKIESRAKKLADRLEAVVDIDP
jgi:hypothetical protein